MVLRRWMVDAVFVCDCRADAITANTFTTQSGLDSSCSSSNASGKPLACEPASTYGHSRYEYSVLTRPITYDKTSATHGRRSRGRDRRDKYPQNLERGDANANCPPQILSYRYKNDCSVVFKIRQNPFSAGALPQTPLGELTTLPRPLSRL